MVGIFLVVAFAAVVQYATGFGFALVSVPLLALVTDPHEAVLIGLMLGIVGNISQAIEGRHVADRAVAGRILAGSLVGLPVGWYIYAHTDSRALQLTIGGIILLAVVVLALGLTLREASRRVDLIVGAVTGVLTTCTGTNGPPVVAVLHARRESPAVFRATSTTTFVGLSTMSLLIHGATGHLHLHQFGTVALALPAVAIGAVGGIRVRRLLSPATFRVVVLVLLTATATVAIATAG